MLYFVFLRTDDGPGQMIRVTDQSVDHNDPKKIVLCRWDFKTFERALEVANAASRLTRKPLIATDAGSGTTPRYDVIFAPQVGDVVSKSFNGDSYPAGTITRISKSLKRIETDKGIKFYRRRETGSWFDGPYAMIQGTHNERAREI